MGAVNCVGYHRVALFHQHDHFWKLLFTKSLLRLVRGLSSPKVWLGEALQATRRSQCIS